MTKLRVETASVTLKENEDFIILVYKKPLKPRTVQMLRKYILNALSRKHEYLKWTKRDIRDRINYAVHDIEFFTKQLEKSRDSVKKQIEGLKAELSRNLLLSAKIEEGRRLLDAFGVILGNFIANKRKNETKAKNKGK